MRLRAALSPPLFVGLALLAAACDEKPRPEVLSDRSNAVLAGDAAAPVAMTATAAHSAAPAAPRKLCGSLPANTKAPKSILPIVAVPGAVSPPAAIPFGVGRWVWVNVWAAYCAPCKEEMPRLLGWQEKLRAAGALLDIAFVSVDDDERQLQRFLEQAPANGVRATYFLAEGGPRKEFLATLGAKETSELPVQALYAPSGQLACLALGAVEDSDYPAIAALVGARH